MSQEIIRVLKTDDFAPEQKDETNIEHIYYVPGFINEKRVAIKSKIMKQIKEIADPNIKINMRKWDDILNEVENLANGTQNDFETEQKFLKETEEKIKQAEYSQLLNQHFLEKS